MAHHHVDSPPTSPCMLDCYLERKDSKLKPNNPENHSSASKLSLLSSNVQWRRRTLTTNFNDATTTTCCKHHGGTTNRLVFLLATMCTVVILLAASAVFFSVTPPLGGVPKIGTSSHPYGAFFFPSASTLSSTSQAFVDAEGIIPWKFSGMGVDPARDRQLEWWASHPDVPLGLSCREYDDDEARNSNSSSHKHDGVEFNSNMYLTPDTSPPLFPGRKPKLAKKSNSRRTESTAGHHLGRRQLAVVISFVDFQLPKRIALLHQQWSTYPPCHKTSSTTNKQSADLIVFTEKPLDPRWQSRIRSFYALLSPDKTGCFSEKDQPIFKTLENEYRPGEDLSHLEGAAYSFYSLFALLEQDYHVFMLMEPDLAPIQSNWLPRLVQDSYKLSCDDNNSGGNGGGVWQLGSPPLAMTGSRSAGQLDALVDLHMNGNSMYLLGCPAFEDYKCRVQTFFYPNGKRCQNVGMEMECCRQVAGCEAEYPHEGGYDHAMYRFRIHPDNYQYARHVMHRFQYSMFVKNLGESPYSSQEIVKSSPSTLLVHSKSLFFTRAAAQITEMTLAIRNQPPCASFFNFQRLEKAYHQLLEQQVYRNLRSGEMTMAEAGNLICQNMPALWTDSKFGVCNALQDSAPARSWLDRMPGKTYLWTMDFHGGPANCDMGLIDEAGGALHAEIDGKCEFYGLCPTERLKQVIRKNNWKEYDPTDEQMQDFYLAYKDNDEFHRVDAFICHHPAANCELFLPFNKSIIVRASTRLEFGRHDAGIDWRLGSGYNKESGKRKWKRWINTLKDLAKDKRNIIAANNVYDQDYIKYFTGIENVELIPSWCGDNVGSTFCQSPWESNILPFMYYPQRPEVIIVPYRSNLDRTRYRLNVRQPTEHPIIQRLRHLPESVTGGTQVKLIHEVYPDDGSPLLMQNHSAVVIIPYQVSTIELIELYRLGIPTFCPSLTLLKQWAQDYDLLWEVNYGWPESLADPAPRGMPGPNGWPGMDRYSDEWENAFSYWIPKSDFYVFPHIQYFDSWEHFFALYHSLSASGGLETIHRKMVVTNMELRTSLVSQWKGILERVRQPPP
jgi:hypothetical protein